MLVGLLAGAADAAACDAAFAEGDGVILLGTGADEVVTGRAAIQQQLQRDFDETDEVRVELGGVRVASAGEWHGR